MQMDWLDNDLDQIRVRREELLDSMEVDDSRAPQSPTLLPQVLPDSPYLDATMSSPIITSEMVTSELAHPSGPPDLELAPGATEAPPDQERTMQTSMEEALDIPEGDMDQPLAYLTISAPGSGAGFPILIWRTGRNGGDRTAGVMDHLLELLGPMVLGSL